MLDRIKLFDFIDDNLDKIGEEGYQDIAFLINSDASDEEVMNTIKNYGVDKLKGFETEILGKEDKEQLSDVPTNISSDEYDEYVKLRNPNESSKSAFGQKVIDDSLDKSKELSEQRKKDVEEYSNFVKRNPYEDMYKNERITAKLNDYDVNKKVNEYISKGLSKSEAYDKVRKDIKDISNKESTSGDVLKSRLLGLGQFLITPKMYEDYYVNTGKYDDNEAKVRAGLGTAMNVLELHPTNGIGKLGKAAVYVGKPVTESVRTNIIDTEEADIPGAIKDATLNSGLNVMFDVPQILPEVLKQSAGLGEVLEKAKPVQDLLEGIQEADKLGNKKPLSQQRDNIKKVYKDYFDVDMDKLFNSYKSEGLKTDDYMDARKRLLSSKLNERIPDINDREKFKDFQLKSAKGFKELENLGEYDIPNKEQYILGLKFNEPIDSKSFKRPYEADRVLYNMSKNPDKNVTNEIKDLMDDVANIYDSTNIKHKKIAKTVKSGMPSGILRGMKSDRSKENEGDKVESFKSYLDNDELALRMWKAGFRPSNMSEEMKKEIDQYINER